MKRALLSCLLAFGFLLSSCALFTSHYDVLRQQNFTQLKAFHVKFLEDWTAGSEKDWSKAVVRKACDAGDLKFREAFEYAKAKDTKDHTGERAVSIVWAQFKSDCALAARKPLSVKLSQQLIAEVSLNYQYAIDGEMARVGAPQ